MEVFKIGSSINQKYAREDKEGSRRYRAMADYCNENNLVLEEAIEYNESLKTEISVYKIVDPSIKSEAQKQLDAISLQKHDMMARKALLDKSDYIYYKEREEHPEASSDELWEIIRTKYPAILKKRAMARARINEIEGMYPELVEEKV